MIKINKWIITSWGTSLRWVQTWIGWLSRRRLVSSRTKYGHSIYCSFQIDSRGTFSLGEVESILALAAWSVALLDSAILRSLVAAIVLVVWFVIHIGSNLKDRWCTSFRWMTGSPYILEGTTSIKLIYLGWCRGMPVVCMHHN